MRAKTRAKGKPPVGRLVLGASLEVRGVCELHAQLGQALATRQVVVLDAAAVERADTAALQALCAFFKAAKSGQVSVEWLRCSATLRNAAQLLGLTACLELPAASGQS